MKLSAVDRGEPFALLGPGFGRGQTLLVSGLRQAAQDREPGARGQALEPSARGQALEPGARGQALEPSARGQALEPSARGEALEPSAGAQDRRPRAGVVAFASFEARLPTILEGHVEPIELELDVPPQPLDPELDERGYFRAVEAIREAIAAGDVYQVCHTTRARLRLVSGSELFSTLCAQGIPRYAAWARLPDGTELVSASPELFFETEGGRVHTEPMKGTARRGEGGRLDASEKDRAELAMITDLLRNDLTPVCRPRSVEVECARRFVELPYAVQAVSDVVGELLPGKGPLDVLAALHPGGSVTGAPKKAALEFIGRLETAPRGAYCGALGLIEEDRSAFGLLIRTAQKTADGWSYGVGSGVVYDSEPEAELEELRVKLGALR